MSDCENYGPYKGKGETVDVVDDRLNQSDSEPSEDDSDEPKYRDKQWLHHQYHVLKKSTTDIAEECGCDDSTIWRWMKKHGLETRSNGMGVSYSMHGDAPWRKREWLYDQYIARGKPIDQIADEQEVAIKTIWEWLDRNDIEIRQKGENSPSYFDEKYMDMEWLVKEYVGRERSAPDIAEECGVDKSTIYHWMDIHGIEARSKSEAQHLASLRENGVPKIEDEESGANTSNTERSVGTASYSGPSKGIDASMRGISERKVKGDWVPYQDEDWLRKQYLSEEKSSTEIADECGADPSTILRWLDEFDIEKRSISEAMEKKEYERDPETGQFV